MDQQDAAPDLNQIALDLWGQYVRDGNLETLDRAVAGFRAAAAGQDPWALSNLSNALLTRHRRTGDLTALEEAVTVARSAVDRAEDPGSQAAALSNLSGALKSSFQLTGDVALLEAASVVLRRAVAIAPDERTRGVVLSNLAGALEMRYARDGSLDALRESVQALRQGLALRAKAEPLPARELVRLANLLRASYERAGDGDALDEAIEITRQIARGAPQGRDQAGLLSNLGLMLCHRYERTGEREVLQEAIDAGRAAVAAVTDDRLLRASVYSNLGNSLRSGYERTGEESLLTDAISAHREAVEASADGHPERALILINADRALELSYENTRLPALLDERVRIRRARLKALPVSGAEQSDELLGIADILRLHHEASADNDILDEVIETLRQAAAAAPAGYPARRLALSNLGVALQVRYARTADKETLAEAVGALSAAVDATPDDDPGRSGTLTTFAQALQRMYELTGDRAVLEEAIAAGRSANSGTDPDQRAPGILADCQQARYERSGDHDDLRQAMELSAGSDSPSQAWAQGPGRRAGNWMDVYLAHRDLDALDRAVEIWDRLLTHPWFDTLTPDMQCGALGGSGVAHLRRYQERSDGADLDEAVRCCKASVEFTEHENYRGHLSNLSSALRNEYLRSGDRKSLSGAADLATAVAEMTAEGSQERADALTNLGGVWRLMREATGDPAHLDTEVETWVQAAQIHVADDSSRPERLNNASVGLHDRYDARGDEADLQRSIEYSRQAVESAPADHRDRPGWLSNLGNTLRHRYERTGVLADLDDAIEVLERAVATAPKQWKDRQRCLMNLGSALRGRARISRSPEFLRRALQAAAEAVELTPVTSPEYSLYAGSLAAGLGTLAEATGEPEQRDTQISLYVELLEGMPDTSARRPWLQAELATALLNRARADNAMPASDSAVELARQALGQFPPGTTSYAHSAGTLAGMLSLRASQDRNVAAEADETYRHACTTALDVEPAFALFTALQWARWCEDEGAWDTAADAYLLAAQAADRLFLTQIGRQDKEAWLRTANGMPTQAALALVRASRCESAALMLERGRVRLLAEALGRNSAALDQLQRHGQGALAERFRAVQRRLGALEASEESGARGDGQADRMRGDDLASALAEHRAALDAIREVPGYERFLLPAELSDLAAAADRPIVYLAAARLGGAALIVTRPAGAAATMPLVELVELSQLTEAAVNRRAMALQYARQRRDTDPALWQGTLDAVCHWLWLAVMGPVVNALAAEPAACLVPTGQLASLPLHAAWTPDESRPVGRRYALDEVTWSYAPSVVAMLHARGVAERQPLAGLLGVADPQPVDARPLPLATAEVEAAAAMIGGPFQELHGSGAARTRILAALPAHSVVHFACHGLARPDMPLDSALLTSHDEPLTLRDLFHLELSDGQRPGIRLAVLSACETQLPGTELPDELIGLPSGFLQAGAAAVVATQWTIGDAAAALVTTMFYRNIASGADGPAALRDAQVWLRDTTNGEKAAFVHPGNGESGLPDTVARRLWRWMVRTPPSERSFAVPSQWAALTYTGI